MDEKVGWAVGEGDCGVRAEGRAVRDGAGSTGVGEYGGVDGEDVGHGEECGGASAEFGCESCVTLGEFEVFSGLALSHEGVELS